MADIKLTDLINVKTLQEVQDGFARLTGMAALTTDADGNPVTVGSNFTDFCMELTRKSREGCKRCEKCDKEGAEKTYSTGKSVTYSCHAGLVDFAAPIMLNGKIIGSFIGGQVLTSQPDEEKFRAIARDLSIDEDKYIAALRKVKVVDKERVEAAADFLFIVANLLSSSAYEAYVIQQSSKSTASINKAVFAKIDEAHNAIEANTKRMGNFTKAFDNLEKIASDYNHEVGSSTETLKQIQDIAMNTKILGFNASIEASRAKEAGKGFGVIAQEVRSLAETSKVSADSIQNAMSRIKENTSEMNDQIAQTRALISQCVADMEKFSRLLDEISNMSNE